MEPSVRSRKSGLAQSGLGDAACLRGLLARTCGGGAQGLRGRCSTAQGGLDRIALPGHAGQARLRSLEVGCGARQGLRNGPQHASRLAARLGDFVDGGCGRVAIVGRLTQPVELARDGLDARGRAGGAARDLGRE